MITTSELRLPARTRIYRFTPYEAPTLNYRASNGEPRGNYDVLPLPDFEWNEAETLASRATSTIRYPRDGSMISRIFLVKHDGALSRQPNNNISPRMSSNPPSLSLSPRQRGVSFRINVQRNRRPNGRINQGARAIGIRRIQQSNAAPSQGDPRVFLATYPQTSRATFVCGGIAAPVGERAGLPNKRNGTLEISRRPRLRRLGRARASA